MGNVVILETRDADGFPVSRERGGWELFKRVLEPNQFLSMPTSI